MILFEGDDHIGQAVNLAARLSDVAGPNQILAPAFMQTSLLVNTRAVPHGEHLEGNRDPGRDRSIRSQTESIRLETSGDPCDRVAQTGRPDLPREVAAEAGFPGAAAIGRVLKVTDGLPWWRVVTSTGRFVPGLARTHAAPEAENGIVRDGRRPLTPAAAGHDRGGAAWRLP